MLKENEQVIFDYGYGVNKSKRLFKQGEVVWINDDAAKKLIGKRIAVAVY